MLGPELRFVDRDFVQFRGKKSLYLVSVETTVC